MANQQPIRIWNTPMVTPAVPVLLVLSGVAGCTAPPARPPTPQARPATPHEVSGASYRVIPDEERGIHIEGGLGFDHTLQVRRSKTGVPHELHDGDSVMAGDRIRVSVMTSEDAHLYVAFCTHQELAVYPSQGGFRARAGELMLAPTGHVELVLDGDPGPEVLYVIVSRRELSLADPKLAQALAAQRPRNTPTDCGTSLDAKLAKPPANAGAARPPAPGSTKVLRGALVAKKPMPSTRLRGDHMARAAAPAAPRGPASGASGENRGSAFRDTTLLAHPPRDPGIQEAGSGTTPSAPGIPQTDIGHTPGAPADTPPPDPDFERSPGDIVWYRVDEATGPADVVAADEDGIAVVRHAFTHVASAASP